MKEVANKEIVSSLATFLRWFYEDNFDISFYFN